MKSSIKKIIIILKRKNDRQQIIYCLYYFFYHMPNVFFAGLLILQLSSGNSFLFFIILQQVVAPCLHNHIAIPSLQNVSIPATSFSFCIISALLLTFFIINIHRLNPYSNCHPNNEDQILQNYLYHPQVFRNAQCCDN